MRLSYWLFSCLPIVSIEIWGMSDPNLIWAWVSAAPSLGGYPVFTMPSRIAHASASALPARRAQESYPSCDDSLILGAEVG